MAEDTSNKAGTAAADTNSSKDMEAKCKDTNSKVDMVAADTSSKEVTEERRKVMVVTRRSTDPEPEMTSFF